MREIPRLKRRVWWKRAAQPTKLNATIAQITTAFITCQVMWLNWTQSVDASYLAYQ